MWTLALVSALALPALSLALPRWQLPLVTRTVYVHESGRSGQRSAASARVHRDRTRTTAPAHGREDRGHAGCQPKRRHQSGELASVAAEYLLAVRVADDLGCRCRLVLLRLATGLLGVLWLSRRTEHVTEAPWLPLARSLAAELGVRRASCSCAAGSAAMPMAWGILRPSVLMPADADTWPAERLRIVLLHELAHVKRRDCLTHMLAQISCALYWFNPLAWMAARHLRTERERACDDLVLAAGTRGPGLCRPAARDRARDALGPFPGAAWPAPAWRWRSARSSRAG